MRIECLCRFRRYFWIWALFVTGLFAADPSGLPHWRIRAEYAPVSTPHVPPVVVVWSYRVIGTVSEEGCLWWRVRADDPEGHALVRCEFLFAPSTRQIRRVVVDELRLGVWTSRDLSWSDTPFFWRDDLIVPLVAMGSSADRNLAMLPTDREGSFPMEIRDEVAGDHYIRRYRIKQAASPHGGERNPQAISSVRSPAATPGERWTIFPEGGKKAALELTWRVGAFWWSDFQTPHLRAVRLDGDNY